jgi:Raf kinase inhibitor-like YbhB/YbcL family protein
MSERTEKTDKDIEINDLPPEETLTPEEKERLAGAGRKPYRPTLEALEAREMMDAGIGGALMSSMAQTAGGDAPATSHVRRLTTAGAQGAADAGQRQLNPLFGNEALEQMGDPRARQQFVETQRFQLTSPDLRTDARPDANGRTNPYQNLPDSSANLNARKMVVGGEPTDGQNGKPTDEGVGQNTRLKLNWANPSRDTKSFAVTMRDLDSPGGPFTHWVVYDIPASATGLDVGLPGRALEGLNGNDQAGYLGMNPAWGQTTHRYEITVYALRTEPGQLAPQMTEVRDDAGQPTGVRGATYQQLMDAMQRENSSGQKAVIAQTSFVGTYTLPGNAPNYNWA